MDNTDDNVFAASDIVHFSGSESHGKPSGGRSDTTEDRSRTYGASDSAGGACSATVAEGRKSGSAESESTAASGTIARYVAATGMDNSDIDAFAASNIFHILHLSGGESHGKSSSRGRGNSTESGCRSHGASDNTTGNVTATNTGNATGNDTETGNDTGTHVSADAAATGGSSGGIYETKQSQIAADDDASSTVLCDGSRADHICGRTETGSRSG